MIRGISSMATRQVLAGAAAGHARSTGERVEIESVGGVDAARRVAAGEAFDFVVLAADALGKLIDAGHALAAGRVDVARSGVALAVRAGAAKPDLSSESAMREALLRARTIGYSTGPSGDHLLALLARWSATEALVPQLVKAPPGVPVATLLARGEAEIGLQQRSELTGIDGIEIAGDLPPSAQAFTTFSAALCVAGTRRDAAAAFLAFLASPATDAVKRRRGMAPARD